MEELRLQRLVVSNQDEASSSIITVFLGLYNAVTYLESIERQLDQQLFADFRLLVVDNNSSDNTWVQITPWVEKFGGRITLVRNPVNIGGAGSIELNLDLISTPWLTFFHQDDVYKSNHLSRLLLGITECDEKVVAISTQMGSLNKAGNRQGTPLRAQQKMVKKDSKSVFLLNIGAHAVPWPATAFRTGAYLENASPWHSTTFTDSEIILKMLCKGNVLNLGCETMYYRENPMSESHTVNPDEALVGAAVALVRVIGSDTFKAFAVSLAPDERPTFRKEILGLIKSRLRGYDHLALVNILLEEVLSHAWVYSDVDSLSEISFYYSKYNSIFTPALMDRLIAFESSLPTEEKSSLKLEIGGIKEEIKLSKIKKFYFKYGWIIPFALRKKILGLISHRRDLDPRT